MRRKGTSKRDTLRGSKGNDVLLGLSGNDKLLGRGKNDRLMGGDGNDRLDGGKGKDVMKGGKGNDFYIVDNVKDKIREKAGQGIDTVQASVNFVLGANIENLVLTGNNALNGTGNTLANTITGNGANNFIDGSIGADTMIGGNGNDLYIVDNANDVVIEQANGGIDIVRTTLSTYTLPANVEFIEYIGQGNFNVVVSDPPKGGSGGNSTGGNSTGGNSTGGGSTGGNVTGGGGNDTVTGGSGGDTLSGGDGQDNVNGGSGNDTVSGGGGNDTVSGGDGNDTIVGGDGNDVLDGGLGVDTLIGGVGDDTYVVDNALDTVEELTGQGTDLVKTTVDYGLRDNIENLELLAGAVKGTGNALANKILGNDGNNILDGGTGADTLIGGLGDDTYVVDNALDQIQEGVGAGTDLVKSTIDYVLRDNLENLELIGSNLKGTGNELANKILGTAGNNLLQGGGGNDTLVGGVGNDTLIGGAGLDQLTGGTGIDVFALKELGEDLLTDFNSAEDIIALDKATFGLTSLLGNALGASEFATVANDATAQLGATVLNPLARIIYSQETGKLFFDQNGLVGGLGSGGVIAKLGDTVSGGAAPVLSSVNFLVDSIS
jgi:Ca2+-binding RTX toxin-like protein